MIAPPFTPLRIDELDLDDQPELALIIIRRAIEERLEWLMSYLAPNERRVERHLDLDLLKSHGGFDAKTVRAIRDVLTAANPVVHGRSVSPSVAAVVADSATRVVAALDKMIERLRVQLMDKPPRTMLAYAFLALPSIRRRAIAQRLLIFEENDDLLPRREFARVVFERASKANLLPDLWAETARFSHEIPPQPPLELENPQDA